MQTIPGIDPNWLGIYGTSFGGANGMWVTAHDERVKCLVTNVAMTHGERWVRLIRREAYEFISPEKSAIGMQEAIVWVRLYL